MPFVLPSGENSTPLLRTDAGQPDRWEALLTRIAVPSVDGFIAYVSAFTDPELEGLGEAEIRRLPRGHHASTFVLVADAVAQASDEFPILVVDLSEDEGPSFRVAVRCLWAVQNNLSIANLDWEDFADAVDADGIYRDC